MGEVDVVDLLRRVLRRGRGLDLRRYEGASAEALLEGLVPRLLKLLQELNAPLRAIAVEEVQAGPGAADLAFVARLELDGVRERLAGLAGRDAELILGECSAAQRTLLRAARAMLEALQGTPRGRRRSAELVAALRLRAAYTQLRRELRSAEEPLPEEVHAAVSTLADRLDAFIAGPAFAEARIEDRMQLRALFERMRGWLHAPEREPRLGLRLWQDAAACAALIARINLRGELVEHDRALVADAVRWLSRSDLPNKVPERLRNRLGRLYGRDDTVDALLEANAQLTESWRAPLSRLHAELEPEVVAQSA